VTTRSAAQRRQELAAAHQEALAGCPSHRVLGRLGDRWVSLVLKELGHGARRHSELATAIAGASQKMLTQTLRGLERDGLVSRSVTPGVPTRVDYALTPLGSSLLPVIDVVTVWAEAHIDEVDAARLRYDANRSGEVLIRDVADGDLEDFFEHQRDPEAGRMAAFPGREREPFMAHWCKIRADPACLTQTIVVDGRVAGNVVSWDQDGIRLVGYWIARSHWGRGVATAALALYLDRDRHRPLHAEVAGHNAGSIRVLEKCGFVRVPPTGGSDEVMLVLE
jgi:DNA-binding HxlR family transcriptional regulator